MLIMRSVKDEPSELASRAERARRKSVLPTIRPSAILDGMDGTRNIKDSLFVAIFNNPDAARELYNAVYGTRYGPETPVVMTTLDDVLYKGIKNDVSFIIGDIYMAMFEQQSTFNPNIPLRIVLYIAHVYEHIIPNKEMHKSTLLKIPRIQPAMFYLCKDPAKSVMKTNRAIMSLSKAFLGLPSGLDGLELNVLKHLAGLQQAAVTAQPAPVCVCNVFHAALGERAAYAACTGGSCRGRLVHSTRYAGGLFPPAP
jgi:hypothetical protein